MNHEILAALFDVPRVLVRPSGRRVEVRSRRLSFGVKAHRFDIGPNRADLVETPNGAFAIVSHGNRLVMSTTVQCDDPYEQREAVDAMLRQMPWWVDPDTNGGM